MLATATNLLTNATVGLMCMMHYYGYAAAIQVNASTGSILSYNLLETTPQALDIATSLPVSRYWASRIAPYGIRLLVSRYILCLIPLYLPERNALTSPCCRSSLPISTIPVST